MRPLQPLQYLLAAALCAPYAAPAEMVKPLSSSVQTAQIFAGGQVVYSYIQPKTMSTASFAICAQDAQGTLHVYDTDRLYQNGGNGDELYIFLRNANRAKTLVDAAILQGKPIDIQTDKNNSRRIKSVSLENLTIILEK